MAAQTRYRLDRVTAEAGETRASNWTFGGEPMSGTEQTYAVRDANFQSRNEWEFLVRIPSGRDGRIEVRPRTTPNAKVWAELPDRSLTFSRATLGGARGKWYCKVALADPTGERSRDVVRGDERNEHQHVGRVRPTRASPHQPIGEQRAEHRRHHHRDKRDLDAGDQRVAQRRGLEELLVPAQAETLEVLE